MDQSFSIIGRKFSNFYMGSWGSLPMYQLNKYRVGKFANGKSDQFPWLLCHQQIRSVGPDGLASFNSFKFFNICVLGLHPVRVKDYS